MADDTCSIDGCERAVFCRGWCNAHYKRWRRHGDPLGGGAPQRPGAVCSVPGCGAPHSCRGWCDKHYQRWRVHGSPDLPPRATLDHRIWSKVDRGSDDECWLWMGAKSAYGYGQLSIDDRTVYAHRLVYEREVGPIPEGMVVMHSCDNPPCVNYLCHLSIGTERDNKLDMISKGRASWQKREGAQP